MRKGTPSAVPARSARSGSGAASSRVEAELDGRPDLASVLLDLRRQLETGRTLELEETHARFAHILNEDEHID